MYQYFAYPGGKLVGGLAVEALILSDEGHGGVVGGVGVEGSQQHNALGQGGVEALHGQDAVHAVHAEELGLIAHGVGLGEDQRGGLIVHGQEDQVGALLLGVGELDGKVIGGVGGEGGVAHDVQTQLLRLGHKLVLDAGGVHIVVLPDDVHVLAQVLLIDILGGGQALVGVGEAHLEHVVFVGDDVGGGGGGGQGEDPVLEVVLGGGDAGLGGDGAQGDLHAPVLQVVEGVDGGLRHVLVVLIVQLELNVAALRVDLVHRDLGAPVGGQAVDGGVAGEGAGGADLEGGAGGIDHLFDGGAGGDAAGGGIAGGAAGAGAAAAAGAAAIAAAGGQGQRHGRGHGEGKKLFAVHNIYSPLQLDSRPEPDTEYKKAAPLQRTKPLLYRNLNGKQPSLWSFGPDDPGQHNQQYPRQKQERRQYAAHYPQNSKNGHHYHGVQNQGSVGGGVVPTGRAAGSRLCSTTGRGIHPHRGLSIRIHGGGSFLQKSNFKFVLL